MKTLIAVVLVLVFVVVSTLLVEAQTPPATKYYGRFTFKVTIPDAANEKAVLADINKAITGTLPTCRTLRSNWAPGSKQKPKTDREKDKEAHPGETQNERNIRIMRESVHPTKKPKVETPVEGPLETTWSLDLSSAHDLASLAKAHEALISLLGDPRVFEGGEAGLAVSKKPW